MDKRYIIGIDLGTTNSALSYVDLEAGQERQIKIFRIPQLTGPGEFAAMPVLPSFLYIPGDYDISKDAITIPWKREDDNFVGSFARDHGAKVPARLVSSAKSWLCHANVDRKARILTWGSGDEVFKVSPVQASAAYLKHIRYAWNSTKGDDADQYLENQVVIITVPASFDEIARDLTVEAAALAGLHNITLLEEPLAAFYSWLIRHEHHWSEFVKPGELILVCDVGGGTTDFTLITLKEVEGSPRFERIAVGDHLILGGDNIDLALARRIETRFSKKNLSLSGDRWKSLCHECRKAKEILLDGEAQSKRITLMGQGGKLISGTMTANLKRQDVEETILEGFFPLCDAETQVKKTAREGITEFGLPYQQEPAVTRHLGWFLERHQQDVERVLNKKGYAPDLILFNGGSLKPTVIQERIRAAIRHWFKTKDSRLPRVLENPEPDLAVALGASYYGLVKIGHGVRVGSGSARAFYLGVGNREQETGSREQGAGSKSQVAICLVERGLDEGSRIELKDKKFEVLANQPVSFDIYSSSFRSGDRLGDLVETDDSLTPLPPIQTVVQYGKKGVKTAIPVQIEAAYTEMGTLALWLQSCVSSHRWQLQFQLRESAASPAAGSDEDVFDETVVAEVCEKVRKAFTDKSDSALRDTLAKEITELIERSRERWPLGLIRAMADVLLDQIKDADITNKFESRWLNLTGFCLRPGFGDGFDEFRIKKLWKIHRRGPVHANNPQVRSEWWILWRRVAGGLSAGQQRQFIQELTPLIFSKKGTKTKVQPQEQLEIWMAVANMELLLVKDKVKWGRQLLSEMQPKKSKPQQLWALSRIGARELLYGSADRVIPPEEAASWIDVILSQGDGGNPKNAVTAVAQMARKTGDRVRDIDNAVMERIIEWMSAYNFSAPHIKMLKEVVPIAKQDENAIFGESLPSGIVLN